MVKPVLLAGRVAHDVQRLALVHSGSGDDGQVAIDPLDDQILVMRHESGTVRRADRVGPAQYARRRIVDERRLQQRFGAAHQIGAFFG